MNPCNVCGGTELNLVDGYYYCVECGTQDVNVRETVVEQTVMGDGTFAHTTSRRITTVVQDKIEMSSEWHKWHTFNFILAGLTDELIALGAKPSIKMKVLWIWSRYVKQFQVKDDLQPKNILDIDGDDDDDDDVDDDDDTMKEKKCNDNDKDSCNENLEDESRNKSTKTKSDKIVRDIKIITRGTILTILYVALLLDKSDIQLSHLFRFIREGRLSLYECMKFVPKELKMNAVKNWKSFILSQTEYNPMSIREMGLTCFKILKLGVPTVPDLSKLVRNFVQELCLPSDVKDLVFALMHYMPIDFLHIDAKIQNSLVRIPDYEGVCMAYILVALKMCFGLDDEYELKISKEVDKINDEENYLRSYKLGLISEPCDRLFSFKEWCQHLQFRKYILCKNYLPMSRQFNGQTDEYVFMEHLERRKKREVKLSDDVTMDILNKIKSDLETSIIPKGEFPVTLTPMSTYIDVIAQHVQDLELRLTLCEDFTQYSLRYAIKDLTLSEYLHNIDNPIVGVSESGKIFNKHVIGTLTVQEGDMTMVYVRNCQNKHWLKTRPPKICHVNKIFQNENSSDRESDYGYESNLENFVCDSDPNQVAVSEEKLYKDDKILEIIDDAHVNKCIFDDNFIDIPMASSNPYDTKVKEEVDNFLDHNAQSNISIDDTKVNSLENTENYEGSEVFTMPFDPNTFNRDKIIKELIELACKKYKIPIPKENIPREINKRKVNIVHDDVAPIEPKKQRTLNRSKPGEAKRVVDNFVSAYYNNLHNDIVNQVSRQVQSIIQDVNIVDDIDTVNISECPIELLESNITNNQSAKIPDVSSLEENETSKIEIDTNVVTPEVNQSDINSDMIEENVEDGVRHELFPKSDPEFDEKLYDIRQLYVKLGENLNVASNISITDISNNPEIDKIIQNQVEQYSKIDRNTIDNNKINDFIDNFSDSDDDIPLSDLKEIRRFEQEKEDRKKEILEPLLKDPSNVKAFKYWIRHYKSVYVIKSRDIGKKFDLELKENLPMSFFFVIRECAAILGYSMFSLYKNMQNIEEILIANIR